MQLYLFRVLVGIFYVDIYQQMSTKKCQNQQKKCQKNAKNYYCEICDVTSNKLSEYKRHLDTKKHKSTEKRQNQQEKCQKMPKKYLMCNKILFQTFRIYENGQFIKFQKCPF